ncbi:MAG: flagellar hook-associated protein FlgK [Idiomarina sp.]|jgi:flagellar hook-associated protein 1 FlgK|uniref:flagellar hook-associated protein FlgK n=1 Tax=Idiomarina TaxID=135575 RepID=UPI00079C2DF3|nr:flagellar hook-associated protein FlgK [Idiomarina sp. T82-3]KXS35230.1 MAG: flagellar hook-associated protein 1 FlgK [Idiomarina sp. T82-3]MAF74782.1 flagellar hook-associated protein FlgK [Idiomarinaceae bacterium]MBR38478.1 flagellar hook-associated protein FlgK [Idiomarina sp.]
MASFDLLTKGQTAVLAHQRALAITGQNINNINNPDYVRERAEYVSNPFGGLRGVESRRMIDEYIVGQLNRSHMDVAFQNGKLDQAEPLDSLLGNTESSINSAVTSFFNSVQDANNDPSSLTNRQVVISEAEGLMTRMSDFSRYLNDQENIVNERVRDSVQQINTLSKNIAELNNELKFGSSNVKGFDANSLRNQRDQQLEELSKLVSFDVVKSDSDAVQVNLKNGVPLVLKDGRYNMITANSQPDTGRVEIQIESTNSSDPTKFYLKPDQLGSALGGYMDYRDNQLLPAQRRIGQMALRIADTMNSQNQKGMDLDNQLGQKLFDLSSTPVRALDFEENTGNANINVGLLEGNSAKLTSDNLLITKTGADTFTVQAADNQGRAIKNAPEVTISTAGNPSAIAVEEYGVELTSANFSAASDGDKFLAKPVEDIAGDIGVAISRPEDLALAKPVRVSDDLENQGSANIELESINGTSNFFDAAGKTLADGAPTGVAVDAVNSDGTFDVTLSRKNGSDITLTGLSDLKNLAQQANDQAAANGNPAPFAGSPLDYDISINGQPAAGDSYSIEYNTDGFDDNRNGEAFTELQQNAQLRRSSADSDDANMTFAEGYSRVVSDIGSYVQQTRSRRDAAQAIEAQTQAMYEAKSGVNLEEEAANLIQFERAYNAAARIITVAQRTFDSLLNAVG